MLVLAGGAAGPVDDVTLAPVEVEPVKPGVTGRMCDDSHEVDSSYVYDYVYEYNILTNLLI